MGGAGGEQKKASTPRPADGGHRRGKGFRVRGSGKEVREEIFLGEQPNREIILFVCGHLRLTLLVLMVTKISYSAARVMMCLLGGRVMMK